MNNGKSVAFWKMYCIYDSKAEHFGAQPFFYSNRADAIRDFEKAANDEKQLICTHAADFTLFEIGTWDTFTGAIVIYPSKTSLGTALEFKRSAVVQ